jgi:nucleoside-diphosphate-sugar epimerase
MKVLITGATGVYGRDLTDRLVRAGHEVVAMARREPAVLRSGVHFHQGDVGDAESVESAMAGCDVVAHLAWVVTPLKSEADTRRINVGGTTNVLAAMAHTGCRRLVFSSSVLCYGANPDNLPRFREDDERRPAPDYLYGAHKKEVEDLILASGVEAVLARTAATVGRNIDNLLVDIFAGPSIIGVKGVDIRYQFVHQDDVGRFLALACEGGPSGPVNVAPDDLLPLPEIARLLGKRYVELSHQQVMAAIRFAWKHDLADITPGEAAAISYLPKVDTTRLRDEWGFRCAWTTAEGVIDLRRAIAGRIAVAKRRVELPWRLRFPQGHTGVVVAAGHPVTDHPATDHPGTGHPAAPDPPGLLDTAVDRRAPLYRAALTRTAPLRPLALTLHVDLLRAAATGLVNAFGSVAPPLAAGAAGSFGHRLYLNDAVVESVALAGPARRRLVSAGYRREVDRLAGTAAEALAWAANPAALPDERLEAALGVVRDEAAWAWAVAATGAVLDGSLDGLFDSLFIREVGGSPFERDTALGVGGAGGSPSGRRRTWRALAERNAAMLGTALVELVAERARRLAATGTIPSAASVIDLTWVELLQPPPADQVTAQIDRRRREHDRLAGIRLPRTLAGAGPVPLPPTAGRNPS